MRPLNFTVRRRQYTVRTSALIGTTAAFAGLGPPVGLLILYLASLSHAIYEHPNVGNILLGFVPMLILFQPFAFMFGFVPALLSGILIALVAHRRPSLFLGHVWRRMALCGCVGAAMSAFWDLIWRYKPMTSQGLMTSDALLMAGFGGISCALLGRVFPTRGWVGAPSNNRWRGP